jgi:hypothetical protein
MTEEQTNQAQETKANDKEYNFRALEAKYERQLAQEKSKREEAERLAQEALARRQHVDDDEEDNPEPYVDDKRLKKKLSSFEKKLEEKIEKKAEEKARLLLEKEKQESWLRQNPDFYEVMKNADKFAQRDPELAETILQMPEGFERQKLVYKNIKALGLHKPEPKQPSIQEKIDANRRSPYYQPSGIGTAPYAPTGDFSPAGQRSAYEKLKELKSRLRI